jgi:hypothetical protein
MLQVIVEGLVDFGLQAIGWAVLKVVTFGRYRGFRPEDVLIEGLVGFATVAAVLYGLWRWLM